MDGMGLGQQKGPMSHSGYEVTTTDVDSEIAKRNVKMVGRSDAGTNLKVGGGGKRLAQLVVLVSAFVMLSTVLSASC